MKLPPTEDDDSEDSLKEILLNFESPFTWDIPEPDIPIEVYIRNQLDKCENIEEEHKFQWTRIVTNLILGYELCDKMEDYAQALEHIQWCMDHWDSLNFNCREPLFQSLKDVLWLVIVATAAHIYLAAGMMDKAREKTGSLQAFHTGFHTRTNKAGLLGLKAAVYLQYRSMGCRQALEMAKEARDLDSKQAEWWFLIGCALNRIRIINRNGTYVSKEEMEAIEKAFVLQKDATYTVYLAQLYADSSMQMFNNRKFEESKNYADKAVMRFREALQLRPNCASMKTRVAHGVLRICYKEASDTSFAKRLLDEVVETTPNRAIVYGDLAFYYTEIDKDLEKALFYNQKSCQVGCRNSVMHLSAFKWKYGLEDQIITDVKESLTKYMRDDDQAMLLGYLGACHVLINGDWGSAISCFQKSLDIDPSAKFLEKFKGFNGKSVNLLELVANHLHFRAKDNIHTANACEFLNHITTKGFLAKITQKKPQNVVFGSRNKFECWKRELETLKVHSTLKLKISTELVKTKQEKLIITQDNAVEEDKEPNAMNCTEVEKESPALNCADDGKEPLAIILNHIKSLSSQVGDSIQIMQATKEDVRSMSGHMKEMREELNSIDEKVEALEPRMTNTECRLEELELKVDILEHGPAERLRVEEIIREINDRKKRARNIILHNLPESIDEAVEIKIIHDKGLLLKVCQAMKYTLDMTGVKLNRIGKPTRGQRRPLIVVFKTEEEAELFLQNLSLDSIKDSDPALADIGVTRDRTDRERQYLKSLREELHNQKSKGEKQLTIKYINGVPSIVSKFSIVK